MAFRGWCTLVLLAALFQVVEPGGPGVVQNRYESQDPPLPALLARSQLLQSQKSEKVYTSEMW